eukprot:8386209-Alexandrium_andersonii.AAC.1
MSASSWRCSSLEAARPCLVRDERAWLGSHRVRLASYALQSCLLHAWLPDASRAVFLLPGSAHAYQGDGA